MDNVAVSATRQLSGKIGCWIICDPIGVMCPFCGREQNIPTEQCPRCSAWLRVRRRARR